MEIGENMLCLGLYVVIGLTVTVWQWFKYKRKQLELERETILRTDGLRGDYPPRRTAWAHGFLRADAQRLLDQLSSNDSPPNERPHAPNT